MHLKKNTNLQQNNKPTIILMTKWHAINRCKSRLSKEIGALKASRIQEKLTNHTIAVAKKLQSEDLAEIKIAIDGVGINAAKRWASLNEIKDVTTQGSGNLGTKMKRQILKAYSKKNISSQISNPILIIGTDLPSLSPYDLSQAIEMLNYNDMVLGPSTDGGYWLIGLSEKLCNPLCIWPFSGISWGTDQVLKKTIQLACIHQINFHLLHKKNDLDNLFDLSPWLKYKNFLLSASSYQL